MAGLVDHGCEPNGRALNPILKRVADFVHLDDIFVMFDVPNGHSRESMAGPGNAPRVGCSNQQASV